MAVIETELGAFANAAARVAFANVRVDGAPTTRTDGPPMRSRLFGLLVRSLLLTLAVAACNGDDAERHASDADDAAVADTELTDGGSDSVHRDSTPGDAERDAEPPGPTLTIEVARADSRTSLPPVSATATVRHADGAPYDGAVTLTAVSPTDAFTPTVSAVEGLNQGRYRVVVSADRSGEVEIAASASVDGQELSAAETVVFLPFLSEDWGVVRAVTSVNTRGPEDSLAVSPDGRTLFFSYTPLWGCDFTPAGLGDPPEKPECRDPAYPINTPERPCDHGIGADGRVTLGLFGDTEVWPWPKGMYNTYVATRRADGSFDHPVCVSFAGDGAVLEVSPSSGASDPVPGETYPLFFGYPDWLDIDLGRHGSIFAVATVTAGESVTLSDPITAISHPPANNLAVSLTGDMNIVREDAEQVGELRVHRNPVTGNHELYFEARMTGETMDVVVSPLEGSYPVGDWGAAVKVPGEVNTDTHDEGFPWMVELPGGELHLYFNRAPVEPFTEPMRIYDSTWETDAWGPPALVMEVPPTGDEGGVMVVALPAVSVGDFGTEMFFVYVLNFPNDELDFQIGVTERL